MSHFDMHDDDHDQGLAFDLKTLVERRHVLGLFGLAGAGVLLAGCDIGGPPANAEANTTAATAEGGVCIKDPTETSGPFPGDGTNSKSSQIVNVLTETGVVREDIRTSFAGMTPVAEGTQFDLAISLVDVSKACAPLAGHAVYIWHCDKDGKYSLYDTEDRNYLRGVGVTDASGVVKFTTIFPGCYDGRWPHIHFEVFASAEKAVSGGDSLLISQFALPGDIAKSLYADDAAYQSSVSNLAATSLNGDMVFADNTPEQIAAQTPKITGDNASGFKGAVTVGIMSA